MSLKLFVFALHLIEAFDYLFLAVPNLERPFLQAVTNGSHNRGEGPNESPTKV